MGEDERGSYLLSATVIQGNVHLQATQNTAGNTQLQMVYNNPLCNLQFVTQPESGFVELSGGVSTEQSYYQLKLASYHIIGSFTQAITKAFHIGTEFQYQMNPMAGKKAAHKTLLRYKRRRGWLLAGLEYGLSEQFPDTMSLTYVNNASRNVDLVTQLQFQHSKQSKRWESDLKLGYSYNLQEFYSKFRALWSLTKNRVLASIEQPVAMVMVQACCKLDLASSEIELGVGFTWQAE